MGGGLAARRGDRGLVVLDPRLVGPDRRAALVHELVHLERGCTDRQDAPRSWHAVTEREEKAVEREVARRLVPRAALAQHVRQAATLDEPVTILGVATEFDVPERVAHNALASLRDTERR